MTEAKFQTKFIHFLKHAQYSSAAFELKVTPTDSLPFSKVLQHQKDALLAVATHKIEYKISDDSRGFKPFDCFVLTGYAYVVIRFNLIKKVYAIDIKTFLEEEKKSKRRSLTSARAAQIGFELDVK